MSGGKGLGTYLKITGCLTGKSGDKWPPRKEFDTFIQDKKQAVLYFLALAELCRRSPDKTDSHFQLAGIHGLPRNIPWPRDATAPELQRGHYCAHGEIFFIPWHRVYLLAYEGCMSKIMMDWVGPDSPNSPIPKEQRGDWKVAAETWRLPYWDFALRRSYNKNNACVPQQALIDGDPLSPLTMDVGLPTLQYPDNPLYAYKYRLPAGKTLKDYGIFGQPEEVPLAIQTRTVRYAPNYDSANSASVQAWTKGTSDLDRLMTNFSAQTKGWRKDLISILTETNTFERFSRGGGRLHPDLEGIHGTLHWVTGGYTRVGQGLIGNGNMVSTECAAFDPIFFIYHAGIDHLAALWQAGHPDKKDPNNWMDATNDRHKLVPFINAHGDYFTSEDVRDWENWGYSYEDTSTITNHFQLVSRVYELYDDAPKVIKPAAAPGVSKISSVPKISPPRPDYVFSCSFPTNAIGPFFLRVYVESDGTKHRLGEIVNFVAPVSSGCDNCDKRREAGNTTTSSTYISPELKELSDKGVIPSFEPDVLEPYLAENLKWTLYGPGELDISTAVPSMKIAVSRRDRAFKENYGPEDGVGRFPAPGEPDYEPPTKFVATVPVRVITAGKPGGLGEGEELY